MSGALEGLVVIAAAIVVLMLVSWEIEQARDLTRDELVELAFCRRVRRRRFWKVPFLRE